MYLLWIEKFVLLSLKKRCIFLFALIQCLSNQITDTSRYKVLYLDESDSVKLFDALKSKGELNSGSSPLVYIIDKNGSLRGRTDDKDEGVLYGYDIRSVAVLNNKMEDDVKVLLAEYRLALKKNYADRK